MMVICVFVCVSPRLQTESDLGSPGGKARIIHKESDIITAFAINKVKPFNADVTEQHKTLREKQRVFLTGLRLFM